MNFEEFSEKFSPLAPLEKIRFIYGHLDELREEEKTRFLLSVIKDPKSSPVVRATSLKFLRQISCEDPTIFQKSLKEKHQAVLKAAQRALKDYETQERQTSYISSSILRKIDSTREKQKRLRILKAIARLKASWVPKVFLEVLSDPNEGIRDFIVKELSQREPLNSTLLYRKLERPPWYVKSAVLKILGLRKNPESIRHIKPLLNDPNVEVRRSITQALGEIGGEEALSLLAKLTKDKNRYVKLSAEQALEKASKVKFT